MASSWTCPSFLTVTLIRDVQLPVATLDVKHNYGMAGYCEIVEVSHVEDALGVPCGRDTVGDCSDCGTRVCNEHAEKCGHCGELFCISCLGSHERAAHGKKPAFTNGEEYSKKRA